MKRRFNIITIGLAICISGVIYNLTWSMQPTSDLIKQIKDTFNIKNARDCRVALSKQLISRHLDPDYQLACVAVGFKNVYVGSIRNMKLMPPLVKQLLRMPDSPIEYFTTIFQEPLAFSARLFLHTQEGKINAYRLAKVFLESALHSEQPLNHYLVGSLLGYNRDEIKFCYQIDPFLMQYKRQYPKAEADNYQLWPEILKHQFELYEKNWENTPAYATLLQHKQLAEKWLRENARKTVEDLKRDIQQLENQIKETCERRLGSQIYPFDVHLIGPEHTTENDKPGDLVAIWDARGELVYGRILKKYYSAAQWFFSINVGYATIKRQEQFIVWNFSKSC